MITCFTGTGGSGKSLDGAREIFTCIRRLGKNCIANFDVNKDVLYRGCEKHGEMFYVTNEQLNVEYLEKYAYQYHFKRDKDGNYELDKDGSIMMAGEAQTLLVIDECQRIFNPRDTSRKDRLKWVEFLCEHRHWGFNILFITPMVKLIDNQISGLIEYDVRHRKLNNYAIFKLLPFACFAGVTYWHGVHEKIDSYFFNYKRRYDGLYNTFKMFKLPDWMQKLELQNKNDVDALEHLSASISPNDDDLSSDELAAMNVSTQLDITSALPERE